jgi:hypothetical protein
VGRARSRARIGTAISYRDSQAATVSFVVLRRQCVTTGAHRTRRHTRCTWTIVRGTFSHADRAGANRLRFSGRVGGKLLRPGSYELRASARSGSGKTSAAVIARFRIVA